MRGAGRAAAPASDPLAPLGPPPAGSAFDWAVSAKAQLDRGNVAAAVDRLAECAAYISRGDAGTAGGSKRAPLSSQGAALVFAWLGAAHRAKGGSSREALAAFDEAIRRDRFCFEALSEKAMLLHRDMEDRNGAEAVFRVATALEGCPGTVFSRFASFLKSARRDAPAAAAAHERASALCPSNSEVLGAAAVFYHGTHSNLGRAEKLYSDAIDADPFHVNNLSNYGLFLAETGGRPDEAERLYRRALSLDGAHANAAYNYAVLLDGRGDKFNAERWYRRCIEVAPRHAFALYNLAVLLMESQRPRTAAAAAASGAAATAASALAARDDAAASEIKDLLERSRDANPNDFLAQRDLGRFLLRCVQGQWPVPAGVATPSLATAGGGPAAPEATFHLAPDISAALSRDLADATEALKSALQLCDGPDAPCSVWLSQAMLDATELLMHASPALDGEERALCERWLRSAAQALMSAEEANGGAALEGDRRSAAPGGGMSRSEVAACVAKGVARVAALEGRRPEAEALYQRAVRRCKGGADPEAFLLFGKFLARGGAAPEACLARAKKCLERARQLSKPSDRRAAAELAALAL